ncbi:hypothetical protein JHK85_056913 [Glycine max]|nr:hypothetical protein JHK85_056913 [Glycine max]KHN11502.1 hypothetical protein glysoja_015397 [Glycine soja]
MPNAVGLLTEKTNTTVQADGKSETIDSHDCLNFSLSQVLCACLLVWNSFCYQHAALKWEWNSD